MTQSLRETMPICTGFIDACREVFGVAAINSSIKAGLQGQQTFYACENGHAVGTKSINRGIPLTDMVIGPLAPAAPAKGASK